MATVAGAFPFDLDHLLSGRCRVLYTADTTVAVPANIADVIDLIGPAYAPKTGWIDLGATKEGAGYERGIDSEGQEIQQANGVVLEEITDTSRTFTASIAEVKPEHLKMTEEGSAISTIAAVPGAGLTGKSAQKRVKFGSISSLTRRRIAFIAQRNVASGAVVEAGNANKNRGRFVMGVLYQTALAADDSGVDLEKGDLVELPVTFQSYPEGGLTSGEEYGSWFTEDAGTIAIA